MFEALATAGAPLWVTILLALVLAVGGGAGMVRLFTAGATARKIDAEGDKADAEADAVSANAVQSIVAAATALVDPLERRVAAAEHKIAGLQEDLHVRDTLAAEHSGWDYIAEEKAAAAGIDLPPRPPLRPPV